MTRLVEFLALPCAMIGGCDNVHSEKNAVNHEMGRLESQINDLKEYCESKVVLLQPMLAKDGN